MTACFRIDRFSGREKIAINVSLSITPESMHGKRFVSVGPSLLSYPFLVIALSVDARLAPAACIIKLPACRNADEAYSHEAQSPHTRSTARHSLVTSLEAFRPPSAILLRVACPPPSHAHSYGHTRAFAWTPTCPYAYVYVCVYMCACECAHTIIYV